MELLTMDDNKLILLRDAIESESGKLILDECRRYMVEVASMTNSNAEWVKGMGLLINRLQSIDNECKKLYDKNGK